MLSLIVDEGLISDLGTLVSMNPTIPSTREKKNLFVAGSRSMLKKRI
jgi:hypothetical protein